MSEQLIARRNLNANQRSYYRGKLYELEKQLHGGDRKSKGNSCLLKDTAQAIAEKQGVSERTVRSDAEFARAVNSLEEISPGSKQDILNGEVTKKAIMRKAKHALPKNKVAIITTLKRQPRPYLKDQFSSF